MKNKIISIINVTMMQAKLFVNGIYKKNTLKDLKDINPCIGDIEVVFNSVVRQ